MSGELLAPGARLGRYRLVGTLGKGAAGIVYAGEDTHLRREVAVKVLTGGIAGDVEWLERFRLEARAAAQLNHPNVVTVHDVGQDGALCYLVMELLTGGTAQARLAGGPLPWPEATCIVADVCRGLAAAHAAGLIHRDVKPSNILLAADGSAKLADFGLAKAPALVPSRLTRLGTVLGTPQYMSPEHCASEPLDGRADLYALGVTYYALLVGRVPYDGPDPLKIIYAHCSAPVPDPREAVPNLPAACAAVIARAMAKSRTERFRTAEEMLAALGALLALAPAALPAGRGTGDQRIAPAPATPFPPTPRPLSTGGEGRFEPPAAVRVPPGTRRRRVVLVFAGLALTVCIVAGLLLAGAFTHGTARSSGGAAAAPLAPLAGRITLRARTPPLTGHKDAVKAVSIAAGRVASAGADGDARVWALDSRTLLHTWHHEFALGAVALSPDGKVVAAGGRARVVHLWDADSGRSLGTIPDLPAFVRSLVFAPSGRHLAVASETDLQLFDVEPPATFRRRPSLLRQQYVVSSASFSADGNRLAACTNQQTVHVWNTATLARQTAPGTLPEHLTAVACSADGSRIAFGSYNGVLHLWEPDRDASPVVLSRSEGCILAAVFAPGGNTLVSAGEWAGPLRVRDLAAGTTVLVPTAFPGPVNGLAFAPDGRLLAAACSDGRVRLWDAVSEEK